MIPARAQGNIFLVLLLGFGILLSALSLPHLGAVIVMLRPSPAAMFAPGVLKKFGLYGPPALGLPPSRRRSAVTTRFSSPFSRQHHLFFLVHDRQKRLDWMLGSHRLTLLHFSGHRQRHPPRHQRAAVLIFLLTEFPFPASLRSPGHSSSPVTRVL